MTKIVRLSRPVYPRWRGELHAAMYNVVTQIGLSPLAWGTLARAAYDICQSRFIPAGAGNSPADR